MHAARVDVTGAQFADAQAAEATGADAGFSAAFTAFHASRHEATIKAVNTDWEIPCCHANARGSPAELNGECMIAHPLKVRNPRRNGFCGAAATRGPVANATGVFRAEHFEVLNTGAWWRAV
ncbi:MAG: hypothetical protein LBV73_23735 [Paraburkholderia sp.]|nr:hypothetical protein [Paraburkholderia sp.]